MSNPTAPVDLSLAGALLMAAAWWLGPELAPYVSTYSLIILGWGAGLLVGVYRMPPDGRRMPIAVYAIVTLVASLGVTVTLTQMLAANASAIVPGVGAFDASGWFLIVAGAIPAIGHDWPRLGAWIVRGAKRRIFGDKSAGGGDAR